MYICKFNNRRKFKKFVTTKTFVKAASKRSALNKASICLTRTFSRELN